MRPAPDTFIWQHAAWPAMRYDLAAIAAQLADVARAQGQLSGRLADVGFELRERATLQSLTDDVLRTSAIEGERLDAASVRSSIARRLGVDIGALAASDRHVDGVVEMVLDATANHAAPLTEARLCAWHAALFPTGRSGLHEITVGAWRRDATGPMQVVSGRGARQRMHFQAPPADVLPTEMANFVAWANADTVEPPLVKAALAHLWLVTLHPFDDGNGRIARAAGDLFLARADGSGERFYSLSAQIQRERDGYYEVLERTQRGPLDVTPWVSWFLQVLQRAVDAASMQHAGVLVKAAFWRRHDHEPLNTRQRTLLNRLLDGFDGRLTNRRWATMAPCSPDTALRDLSDLVARGILRRTPGGGRSTAYVLGDAGPARSRSVADGRRAAASLESPSCPPAAAST